MTELSANHGVAIKALQPKDLEDTIAGLRERGLKSAIRQFKEMVGVLLKAESRGGEVQEDLESQIYKRITASTQADFDNAGKRDLSTAEGRSEMIHVELADGGMLMQLVREKAREVLKPTQFLRQLADLLNTEFSRIPEILGRIKDSNYKSILQIHACDLRELEARIRDIIADNEEHVRTLLRNGTYAREYERMQR